MQGLKERYERHHQCIYDEAALEAAVALSARYVADRFLPDKVTPTYLSNLLFHNLLPSQTIIIYPPTGIFPHAYHDAQGIGDLGFY